MSGLSSDRSWYDYLIALKQEAIGNEEEAIRYHTAKLENLRAGLTGLEAARDAYAAPAESTPAKPRRKTKAKAEAPAPTVTLEDVRAVMIELSRAGKREVAKDIISSYGAQALSEVDPAHFAEALDKAKEALNA